MEHEVIEGQADLIGRYPTGKLPPEESSSFEEHFVDCPKCIELLQSTSDFLQGMRFVAAEEASHVDRQQTRGEFATYLPTPLRERRVFATVSLVLLMMIVGAVLAVNYTRRLRTDAQQAKVFSELWQQRYEDERKSAMSATEAYGESQMQQAKQLRAMEEKLKEEVAQRAKTTEARPATRSDGNLAIFVLTSTRSGAEEANQIHVTSASFAFSISLETTMPFEGYRIAIYDSRHRLISRDRKRTPDSHNSLAILLSSVSFRTGHYTLVVEGVNKEGRWEEVGNYPFEIIKTR